jgi:hypothetical protein
MVIEATGANKAIFFNTALLAHLEAVRWEGCFKA